MENTPRIFFDDDRPQWYLAQGDHWVGPLAASDVYGRVVAGEISLAHFAWKPGQAEWKRICDIKSFQSAVPALPAKGMQSEVKQAAKPAVKSGKSAAQRAKPPAMPEDDSGESKWFLYYDESLYGPFTREEVSRFLKVGKIFGGTFAWCEGMETWHKISDIGELSGALEESKKIKLPPSLKKSERRSSPRRPLIAKIFLSNDESVITAVCRDISVGGMQLLTDRIPGPVGTKVKLNVSPSGSSSNFTYKHLEPFVAEGVIVRILEDGRGFSFRFEKVSEGAKRAIESYIQSGD